MKNQMKLFTRMVMGIIVIISVTGCSNDEFFGFESSDNHFDDLNISMAFKYGTFLDWDYNGILADASEEDKMIYFEAMQRCNYYYQNTTPIQVNDIYFPIRIVSSGLHISSVYM